MANEKSGAGYGNHGGDESFEPGEEKTDASLPSEGSAPDEDEDDEEDRLKR